MFSQSWIIQFWCPVGYKLLKIVGHRNPGPKHKPFQPHFIFVQIEAVQINLAGGFNSFISLFLNSPPGIVSEYVSFPIPLSYIHVKRFLCQCSTPPYPLKNKSNYLCFGCFWQYFVNTNRNKKIRVVKEVVFHNGLFKHQLFSENSPKMEFSVFWKDFSNKIFPQSLGCQTWFYLFLKLLMGYF